MNQIKSMIHFWLIRLEDLQEKQTTVFKGIRYYQFKKQIQMRANIIKFHVRSHFIYYW
jgi:hypothetical protein